MNPRIFREYDIRGVAERDLSDEFVGDLGRALALHIAAELPAGQAPTIAVGRDCRLSSPRLFRALTSGMIECGARIIDIGIVPTPVLYFAASSLKSSGAVIITGSHNPGEDNGFKMLRGTHSIHGDEVQTLRRRIEARELQGSLPTGSLEERSVTEDYLRHAESQLRLGERRPRLVVDAGNGTGGPTAVALYERLGFEVTPLYCDMDGSFPNHHPDPTVEHNLEDLKAAVLEAGADLGIALDGDADRIGAVDGKGRVLWGDQLLILFGRAVLKEQPGATILGEVKCSQALYDELEKAGAKAVMGKVGHSLIKAMMKESGALLAGEMSGHIFFAHRYLGFDDAIYSGARLLEILSKTDQSLADLRDTLPSMVNTPEIRVECPDDIKFAVVEAVTSEMRSRDDVEGIVDIDGVRVRFADGWGLVRASNTQPSLVLRCEAHSSERLAAICELLESAIASARSAL